MEKDIAVLSSEIQVEVLKGIADLKLEQERTNSLLLEMGWHQGWIGRGHDPTGGPVPCFDERNAG